MVVLVVGILLGLSLSFVDSYYDFNLLDKLADFVKSKTEGGVK